MLWKLCWPILVLAYLETVNGDSSSDSRCKTLPGNSGNTKYKPDAPHTCLIITVDPGSSIRIYINTATNNTQWPCFDKPNSDYVEVYDGGRYTGNSSAYYCSWPVWIHTQSETVNLGFVSYARYEYEISYSKVPRKSDCGGQFQFHGYIQSPSYPDPYPAYRICYYHLMVEPKQSIKLEIQSLHIRANYSGERAKCLDRLEYHDGVNGSNPTKDWFCGGKPTSIQSSSNTMTLMFRSYGNSNHTGFRAYFNGSGCGGNVHLSPQSRFGSPLKGGLYPPNQLCVWTLHAPLQLHAMIQYITFDMNDEKNCCMSHVSVYDGMYGDSKRLARNCTLGNVKDYVVMGSSESLTVVFYTTNGLQHKGISVLAQGSLKKN